MTWGEWVNSDYNTSTSLVPFEEYIKEYNPSFSYSDNDWVSANLQYSQVKGATHVFKYAIFARPDGRGLNISGISFYKDGTLLASSGTDYNTNDSHFITLIGTSTIVSLTDTIIAGQEYTKNYID